MFKFLRRRAPQQEGPPVEECVDLDQGASLLALDEHGFVFQSKTIYPLNRPLEITVSVPQPDGQSKRRRAEITLADARLIADDLHEYVGHLEDVSAEMNGHLLQAIEETTSQRQSRQGLRTRDSDRAALTFGVISRAFKNFKAVSGDLSPTGLKVFVEAEVAVGQRIEITMDFDDDNFSSVTCQADVMWCRPHERNFAAGLRFCELTERQALVIGAYIRHVEAYTARIIRRPPA